MTGEQAELFPRPPGSKPPRPARVEATDAKVRYTRYTPRRRQLCDDCVLLIHQVGVLVAPVPAGVRWRRTAGTESLHLCHAHKEARTEEEK